MLTATEYDQHCADLEKRRAEREGRKAEVWPTQGGDPGVEIAVEVAPGRGDLNITSTFWPGFPLALALIGKTVSFTRLYESQPFVGACIDRMVRSAVRVPLKCYQRTGADNNRQRLYKGDHPLATAIEEPWERGTQAGLVQAQLGPVLVNGNSVIRVDHPNADTIRFDPKDWRFCRPIMPWRDSLVGFTFDTDIPALKQDVSIDMVMHTCWWAPSGPIGISPLQQLGMTLAIEDAAQRWQKASFAQGQRPPSAVSMSEEFYKLDRETRKELEEQLRKDLIALYATPENAGKPALLPYGLEWKGVGQTIVEAALIDQRKLDREEVCAVYQMPPPLVGILDQATFRNIEVLRDMLYTDCLGPPLILMEQSITAQIARDLLGDDDVYVEFDFGAVLRGNRLAEIQALRDGIGTGLLSPNEGRTVLNLPQVDLPGMDDRYLPFNNLQPIGHPPVPGVGAAVPAVPADPSAKRLHVRSRDADFDRIFAGL